MNAALVVADHEQFDGAATLIGKVAPDDGRATEGASLTDVAQLAPGVGVGVDCDGDVGDLLLHPATAVRRAVVRTNRISGEGRTPANREL
jgi:hypothetical protein